MSATEDQRGERRFITTLSLMLEGCRARTFVNWKNSNVKVEDLAAARLFCVRDHDIAKCVNCNGFISMWSPGNDPRVEHEKHFVDCAIFRAPAVFGNIPLVGEDEEQTKACKFLHEYHDFLLSRTLPHPPEELLHTDARKELKVEAAVYPYMLESFNRLQTFVQWPREIGISPEAMTDAGFFSTGVTDWVRCFYCGGGLFGWLKTDDPLRDHARFFSFCPFIKEKLGEEEVQKIVTENPPPKTEDRSVELTDEEVELLMNLPICRHSLKMTLTKEDVKPVIKQKIEKDGILYKKVTKLAEVVFDYLDEIRRKNRLATLAALKIAQTDAPEAPEAAEK